MAKKKEESIQKVNILPTVAILKVLSHLPYRPWTALCEFVDNSVASWETSSKELKKIEGEAYQLQVRITTAPGRIIIEDNAAGIKIDEYKRAFRPAELPDIRSGLNEFGMGMKSAACWFAKKWEVETSALGESVARTISFDLDEIVSDRIDELDIAEEAAPAESHYTKVTLWDLNHTVKHHKTRQKITGHLREIFSAFTRSGQLQLYFDSNEPLTWQPPKFLMAPRAKTDGTPENDKDIEWKKEVDFDFGGNMKVKGYVALLETMSTREAGISLFRRNRIILGSFDEKYRPPEICGSTGSPEFKRIVGELHLSGFRVTHTKDGFQWDDHEEDFLELLKEHLEGKESKPAGLLRQARLYRQKLTDKELKHVDSILDTTGQALQENIPEVIEELNESEITEETTEPTPNEEIFREKNYPIQLSGESWEVVLQVSNKNPGSPWLSFSETDASSDDGDTIHQLTICVSLEHRFMRRFSQVNEKVLEPIYRIAVGLAIAEKSAMHGDFTDAPLVRQKLNQLLEEALSAN